MNIALPPTIIRHLARHSLDADEVKTNMIAFLNRQRGCKMIFMQSLRAIGFHDLADAVESWWKASKHVGMKPVVLAMKVEGDLYQSIVEALQAKGIDVFSVHDSFIVSVDHAEETATIIRQVLQHSIGQVPSLKKAADKSCLDSTALLHQTQQQSIYVSKQGYRAIKPTQATQYFWWLVKIWSEFGTTAPPFFSFSNVQAA